MIALIVAGHGAAHACKRGGKVIYKEVQSPMPGYDDSVPNATFQIWATGKWSRVQEMPGGQEPASWGGCLTRAHLKELKRALKKAKFKNGAPEMCDAVSEIQVEHQAPQRRKTVRTSTPCGETVDPTTAALVACASAEGSAKELRAICRGAK